MKIIILDTLLKQQENREIATQSMQRIDKELHNFADIVDEGHSAILEYLTQGNDGKPFRGVNFSAGRVRVYKYDLTKGDRLLYTYGKYLSYLAEEDQDSIVLISYSKHDNQEDEAKTQNFMFPHQYIDVKEYIMNSDILNEPGEKTKLTDEEWYSIANVLLSVGFKGYSMSEEEMKKLTPNDIERMMLLSKEQRSYIEDWISEPAPTLITGGAGTGKTVIAIRFLDGFNNENSEKWAAYFTQSKELLSKARKQFCTLLGEDTEENEFDTPQGNTVGFWNINEYCLEQLGLYRSNLVQAEEFKKYCSEQQDILSLCKKIGISLDDVWTEIRGVLKGSMGVKWRHNYAISQDTLPPVVDSLCRKKLLARVKDNSKLLILPFEVEEAIARAKSVSLNEAEQRTYLEIVRYFENFDTNLRMLPKNEYLDVSNEISVLSPEQRAHVYDICEKYDNYLISESLYDENDLIRMMVANEANFNISYDFIVVDEVQDYTELQLYYIHSICHEENKNTLIFAGDIHQIINPTVFNHERLKQLFLDKNSNSKLIVRNLHSNFRCQQGIVNAANALSELRRHIIGRKSHEFEQTEEAVEPIVNSTPFRLAYSEENIKDMLNEVMKYPRIAVLVSSERTKQKLINIIGPDKYKDYNADFIFTLSEIKGMEYQYIVCIDLFEDFLSSWNEIVANDLCKKQETRFRLYFNMIYVALTRAQYHVCFMDKHIIPEVDDYIGLNQFKEFAPSNMYFDTLGDSLWDWYEMAEELRANGEYERALQYYQKSGEFASADDIVQCNIGSAERNKDFDSLIKYYLLLGNQAKAKQYINEPTVNKHTVKLFECFDNPLKSGSIINLVDTVYAGFSSDNRNAVYSNILKKMQTLALEFADKGIMEGNKNG